MKTARASRENGFESVPSNFKEQEENYETKLYKNKHNKW
jgi:hypothetical protein